MEYVMENKQSWGMLIPKGTIKEDDKIHFVSYNARPERKMWQVWTEGYAATGEYGTATYHGECFAESFDEACKKILGDSVDFHYGYPSVWACKCYDNEIDARKSFG